MANVSPIDHSLSTILRLTAHNLYVTEDGIKEIGCPERTFRRLLSWTGFVDSTTQACARASLTAIAKTWKTLKEENPESSRTALLALARFVRTLVVQDPTKLLSRLETKSKKAHALFIEILGNTFGCEGSTLTPSLVDRWGMAELYLTGEAGFTKNYRHAQELLFRHERKDDPGTHAIRYDFLVKAVAANHPEAKTDLAFLHKEGSKGVEKNVPYAKQLLTEALAQGYSPAGEALNEFIAPRKSVREWLGSLFPSLSRGREEHRPVASTVPPQSMQLALYRGAAPATSSLAQLGTRVLAVFRSPPPPPPETVDIRQLRADAAEGNADACLELAVRCKGGLRGADQDEAAAMVHFRTAVAEGNDQALDVTCMEMQSRGITTPSSEGGASSGDGGTALALFDPSQTEFADEMRAHALVWTGHFFLKDGSREYNPTRAMRCFERAQKLGCAAATHSIGLYHQSVTGNDKKALERFRRAARKGALPEAQYELGMCYLHGTAMKRPDFEEARKNFELAAADDYCPAMHQLSRLLKEGIGGPADPRRAEKLLLKLESEYLEYAPGDALAEIANLYRCGGIFIKRNLKRAFDLYEKGREKGSVLAYVLEAGMYTVRSNHPFGDSTPEADRRKAFSLLKEADQVERRQKVKEHGRLTRGEGAFALGRALEQGVICGVDEEFALALIHRAAQEGCDKAWRRLSDVYKHGSLGTNFLVQKPEDREARSERMDKFIRRFHEEQLFNPKELPIVFAHPRPGVV